MIIRYTNFFKSLDLALPEGTLLDDYKNLEDLLPRESVDRLRSTFPRTPLNELVAFRMNGETKGEMVWCHRDVPKFRKRCITT